MHGKLCHALRWAGWAAMISCLNTPQERFCTSIIDVIIIIIIIVIILNVIFILVISNIAIDITPSS